MLQDVVPDLYGEARRLECQWEALDDDVHGTIEALKVCHLCIWKRLTHSR